MTKRHWPVFCREAGSKLRARMIAYKLILFKAFSMAAHREADPRTESNSIGNGLRMDDTR